MYHSLIQRLRGSWARLPASVTGGSRGWLWITCPTGRQLDSWKLSRLRDKWSFVAREGEDHPKTFAHASGALRDPTGAVMESNGRAANQIAPNEVHPRALAAHLSWDQTFRTAKKEHRSEWLSSARDGSAEGRAQAAALSGSTWVAETEKVGWRWAARGQPRTQTQSLYSSRLTT
jgi:hypothetical protein